LECLCFAASCTNASLKPEGMVAGIASFLRSNVAEAREIAAHAVTLSR
jgi:hypothetical protein